MSALFDESRLIMQTQHRAGAMRNLTGQCNISVVEHYVYALINPKIYLESEYTHVTLVCKCSLSNEDEISTWRECGIGLNGACK